MGITAENEEHLNQDEHECCCHGEGHGKGEHECCHGEGHGEGDDRDGQEEAQERARMLLSWRRTWRGALLPPGE